MDKEFIESFLAGEFRNESIKRFNAKGTWSSFQKAYLLNLVLWNFTDAIIVDDIAFGFEVNTEKYNPGWVVITTNNEDLFKVYFVVEGMLLESIDDVYITDLVKEIDRTV